MPNQPILFSMRESQAVNRDTWQQFKTAAAANGHTIVAIFRAFVLSYIENGLGPAEKHYPKGEPGPDTR